MTKLSQTALYGELLTNEQQYNKEIGVGDFVGLTDEEENVLIQRARQGDVQAGYELVLALAPYVAKFVMRRRRSLWAKGVAIENLEYLDLVQVGNLTMLERLSDALYARRPAAYLLDAAYKSIAHYCYRHESSIDTPQYSQCVKVDSLHVLLQDDSKADFLEMLTEPDPVPPSPYRDYAPLHQAVKTLPEKQQEVVVRHYGLFDSPSEEIGDLSRQWYTNGSGSCSQVLHRALLRLNKVTASTYTPDTQENMKELLQVRRVRTTPIVQLSQEQRDKLEQAHSRLLERNERVSSRNLAKEAHLSKDAAISYLYQYRQEHPELTRYERLEQAYTRLQASGQRISTRSLSVAAGVDKSVAGAYLHALQCEQVPA